MGNDNNSKKKDDYTYPIMLRFSNPLEKKAYECIKNFDRTKYGNLKQFILMRIIGEKEYDSVISSLVEKNESNLQINSFDTEKFFDAFNQNFNNNESSIVKKLSSELEDSKTEILSSIEELKRIMDSISATSNIQSSGESYQNMQQNSNLNNQSFNSNGMGMMQEQYPYQQGQQGYPYPAQQHQNYNVNGYQPYNQPQFQPQNGNENMNFVPPNPQEKQPVDQQNNLQQPAKVSREDNFNPMPDEVDENFLLNYADDLE